MKRLFAAATLLTAMLLAMPALADDDPQSLVGKDAPQVKLPLLGGGELDLSAFKGKKYVVLDFWASWCPWCRKSTEHFLKTAEKYKDKDVAFYMVAVRDKEEAIKKYLTDNKIAPQLALDPKREMADPYLVDGIPHIVVIDKDGKIVKVAVGEDKVGPAMEEALSTAFGAEKK